MRPDTLKSVAQKRNLAIGAIGQVRQILRGYVPPSIVDGVIQAALIENDRQWRASKQKIREAK